MHMMRITTIQSGTLIQFRVISIFIFLTLTFGSINNIKRLEWIDPYGRKPMKHSKWHKEHVDQKEPTKIDKVYEKITKRRQNLVDI
ncbi:unnamed protein product, partial [marine sediment metagenome]